MEDLIKKINVYPNPASDIINIAFNEMYQLNGKIEIEMNSTTGESVFTGSYEPNTRQANQEFEIPISSYQSGTYLIRFSNQTQELGIVRLFIKN